MSPLAALAPDQRAILELLLRQGRSYGELSELLGLPEDGVRSRAHAALAALAPDRAAPTGEDGAVADWLLGQHEAGEGDRTRDSVAAIPAWRAWAAEVAQRLGEVDGATVPDVPEGAEPAPPAEPTPTRAARRPRPVRDAAPAAAKAPDPAPTKAPEAAPTTAAAPPTKPPEPAPQGPAAPEPDRRSSRVGGAILIGVLVVLVAVVVFVLFLNGDDNKTSASDSGSKAAATATPTATPQVVSQVVLKGVGNSAQGLMQVVKREADGKLVFVLAAEKVPPNKAREVYAVWFTKKGTAPRNLGYAQAQVGKDGRFTTGGPQKGQEDAFAQWLTSYSKVVIARASASSGSSKRPGPIVLQGTLPGGN